MSNPTKVFDMLVKTGALKFGEFTLASGKKSNYYVDIKQLTLSAAGIEAVARAVVYEIEDFQAKHDVDIQAVGGPELGAVAIVGATLFWAYKFSGMEDLVGFIIRKQAKEHGTKKLIEGPISDKKGLNVVVLEDVTTTGDSAIRAVQILKEQGHNPVLVVAVVDRQEGAEEKMKHMGVQFRPILRAKDILDSEQHYGYGCNSEDFLDSR